MITEDFTYFKILKRFSRKLQARNKLSMNNYNMYVIRLYIINFTVLW